MMVTNKKSR